MGGTALNYFIKAFFTLQNMKISEIITNFVKNLVSLSKSY